MRRERLVVLFRKVFALRNLEPWRYNSDEDALCSLLVRRQMRIICVEQISFASLKCCQEGFRFAQS